MFPHPDAQGYRAILRMSPAIILKQLSLQAVPLLRMGGPFPPASPDFGRLWRYSFPPKFYHMAGVLPGKAKWDPHVSAWELASSKANSG